MLKYVFAAFMILTVGFGVNHIITDTVVQASSVEEGEDGVDPGIANGAEASENSAQEQPQLKFKIGTQQDVDFITHIPFTYLVITSVNDEPVTLTNISVNRGSCHDYNNYDGSKYRTTYNTTLKFGQQKKIRLMSGCDILEIDIVTKEQGGVRYTAQ